MESQPQNPEIRIHPENFQPCMYTGRTEDFSQVSSQGSDDPVHPCSLTTASGFIQTWQNKIP